MDEATQTFFGGFFSWQLTCCTVYSDMMTGEN